MKILPTLLEARPSDSGYGLSDGGSWGVPREFWPPPHNSRVSALPPRESIVSSVASRGSDTSPHSSPVPEPVPGPIRVNLPAASFRKNPAPEPVQSRFLTRAHSLASHNSPGKPWPRVTPA